MTAGSTAEWRGENGEPAGVLAPRQPAVGQEVSTAYLTDRATQRRYVLNEVD